MAGTNDEALVGLVIVSHSASIADGVAELVAQVAGPDVAIVPAGGGPDGTLGTDGDRVRVICAGAPKSNPAQSPSAAWASK